jgi:parvulin-like peptidyl-prolyl isomerase
MRPIVAMLFFAYLAGRAETIDRIAVTLDRSVITVSEIVEQVRVSAFLDQKPPVFTAESLSAAAGRLVEQHLIRREMAIANYGSPSADSVTKLVDSIVARFESRDAYERALAAAGLDEPTLREHLQWQLMVIRFVDLRFRPAVRFTEEEIDSYYSGPFAEEWKRNSTLPLPSLDEVHDTVEQRLTAREVDRALEKWLEQARAQASIQIREAAIEDHAKQLQTKAVAQ